MKKVAHQEVDPNTYKLLHKALKKFGMQPLGDIEEVNMFTKDHTVLNIKAPMTQYSVRENMLFTTGKVVKKDLVDMMPDILKQVGQKQYTYLKSKLKQMQAEIDEDPVQKEMAEINEASIGKYSKVD